MCLEVWKLRDGVKVELQSAQIVSSRENNLDPE